MCDLFPNVDPTHPPVRDTRMDPEDQIVVGAQVCLKKYYTGIKTNCYIITYCNFFPNRRICP